MLPNRTCCGPAINDVAVKIPGDVLTAAPPRRRHFVTAVTGVALALVASYAAAEDIPQIPQLAITIVGDTYEAAVLWKLKCLGSTRYSKTSSESHAFTIQDCNDQWWEWKIVDAGRLVRNDRPLPEPQLGRAAGTPGSSPSQPPVVPTQQDPPGRAAGTPGLIPPPPPPR